MFRFPRGVFTAHDRIDIAPAVFFTRQPDSCDRADGSGTGGVVVVAAPVGEVVTGLMAGASEVAGLIQIQA